MSDIEQRLTDMMKTAMRAKDRRTLDLVRMVKSRMTERRTQKGFSGEVNDALWVEVISAYSKSLKKGISEYEKAGGGEDAIANLTWEIEQLEQFLPQKADEATTRGWVEAAIAGLGGLENAKMGAVMGAVMKAHKDEVEASLVKQLAQELLA